MLNRVQAEKRAYNIFFAVIALLFVACSYVTEFSPLEIWRNSDAFWSFLADDFFPPYFPTDIRLWNILSSMVVTLSIALSATTVAGLLAFGTALFASQLVSPLPFLAKPVRGLATFLRNIPALVWAFILFSSLGIGTGVGFVALCITSYAFMVRAFTETMEDMSSDCLESLQAVGATFPQRVVHGVLPSCISGFLAWFLYCVEVNVRASAIVGMVGGGGVGMVLFSYLKSFNYHMAFSVILLIAAVVILVDLLTGKIRRELDRCIKAFCVTTAVLCTASLVYLDLDWLKLLGRVPDVGVVFWRLAHLDFKYMDLIAQAMAETISITVLSTLYSVVLGLFFGMLAAANVTRSRWLSLLVQTSFTFLRAVPTPVWVLLMMVCLGMGPAAGIAGLCVHTTAFFTRAFSQSFESIPSETLEVLEATGVGRVGIFTNIVLPAALSQLIAWIAMRFEINFSECAILGMIGAGGIGFVISKSIQSYEYGTAGVAILLVFMLAYSIERAFVMIKNTIK